MHLTNICILFLRKNDIVLQAVYDHILYYLPCAKDTLVKRCRALVVQNQRKLEEEPMRLLEEGRKYYTSLYAIITVRSKVFPMSLKYCQQVNISLKLSNKLCIYFVVNLSATRVLYYHVFNWFLLCLSNNVFVIFQL